MLIIRGWYCIGDWGLWEMTSDVREIEWERACRAEDSSLVGPVALLRECIRQIESGEVAASSALVVLIDRGPDGDHFEAHWRLAKMKRREAIAAMEQVKFDMLDN